MSASQTDVSVPQHLRRLSRPIVFSEDLPFSAHCADITAAIRGSQVVIVCGETGSGKTTQLPKLALSLGRGTVNSGKLIGHTQPRRIAAVSVAKRIAEELQSPLGEVVGYKVRFQDRLHAGASIKLMTDGILLAETGSDPLLQAYDTLILDEAHERSLNIDFLLGYLRQILPQRPDLKLIVTSATVDAQRFSQYFEPVCGLTPVVHIQGRTFPVEQRWRPLEDRQDSEMQSALLDALDELWREGPGDILVFLPGEREIREAADRVRRHCEHLHHRVDVLPLYARLSQAEQGRIFTPGSCRRVVLATNVAETSLTVPGIRYVIDIGLARVKRYSYKSKVEQLQIEPISQAAAIQRAGRCGRVGHGVCIRLYAEADFQSRPAYTDPEILRSSLAAVILRMKSLGIGSIENFHFLDAPPNKAIADGYALLAELNAIDASNALTPTGRMLARLPLDPRIGRMILEAQHRHSLAEVLIIAAALTVQDVRDRPVEKQQIADAKHQKFADEKSEFMGLLKLWHWLEEVRGAAKTGKAQHKLSRRQQEQRLIENLISPRRVREWQDVHSQLLVAAAEQGWRVNTAPATYAQIHIAVLAGLLGNVGLKSEDPGVYLGARGIKFRCHPGVYLSKRPGRWLVVAELVETTRLYARGVAHIDAAWIPEIASHLLKIQLLDPHWEKKAAEVMAIERATLYGLVVYSDKRVNYARINPGLAREVFISEALVAGQWDTALPFWRHNQKLIRQIEAFEHKSRRQDVLVDEALIHAYYDHHLPADVVSGLALEKWYQARCKKQPELLMLTQDILMRHGADGVTSVRYPQLIRLGGVDCPVSYLHAVNDAKDGATATVPIYALNQVNETACEWLVPGMLPAKVQCLIKHLPQRVRARLIPLQKFGETFCEGVKFGDGGLLDVLLDAVRQHTQLDVQRADFKMDQLPPHLLLNLRVVDEHGRLLGMGRQLSRLKAELGGHARSAFQALAEFKAVQKSSEPGQIMQARTSQAPAQGSSAGVAMSGQRVGAEASGEVKYVGWDFEPLPELMEIQNKGQILIGFPAILDAGDGVTISVFDEPELAERHHRGGLRRLVMLAVREQLKYLEKNIPDMHKMAVLYMALGTQDELREQLIRVAVDRAFLSDPWPSDRLTFLKCIEDGRSRLNLITQEVSRTVGTILAQYTVVLRKLKDMKPTREVTEDIQCQLQRLVNKHFISETPWRSMAHLPRYLAAIGVRLDKWRQDPQRDARRCAELRPLEQRYWRHVLTLKGAEVQGMTDYRWMLEELRVSFFAQELRTPQPVSAKRLDKFWAQLMA